MTSRRRFLQTSAILPFALKGFSGNIKAYKPLLSFSTLGCPDWTFTQIVDFAAANGYNGIEFRGIQRELYLPKCPEFNSVQHITESKSKLADKGLKVADLGSSTELHHQDAATRAKNIDEGKRFIDLAEKLDCPYIRVFPNNLPKNEERSKVTDLIIQGLAELGDFAKGSKVRVLMESHGDAVKTEELKKIMEATVQNNTGLVWDIVNMWSVTKEPPAAVYNQLNKYICHTHLKDLQFEGDKIHYVQFGTGVAPVYEAIDALYKGGYKGYYSFEWEKLWHPEIDDPQVALAGFPKAMRKHFEGISRQAT
jgi:sugar phosphate isomerase/epimerase